MAEEIKTYYVTIDGATAATSYAGVVKHYTPEQAAAAARLNIGAPEDTLAVVRFDGHPNEGKGVYVLGATDGR